MVKYLSSYYYYLSDIMMQKYRSKYHVQKVEPVKSRTKNIQNNPIFNYKSQKASIIPKKTQPYLKQLDD